MTLNSAWFDNKKIHLVFLMLKEKNERALKKCCVTALHCSLSMGDLSVKKVLNFQLKKKKDISKKLAHTKLQRWVTLDWMFATWRRPFLQTSTETQACHLVALRDQEQQQQKRAIFKRIIFSANVKNPNAIDKCKSTLSNRLKSKKRDCMKEMAKRLQATNRLLPGIFCFALELV